MSRRSGPAFFPTVSSADKDTQLAWPSTVSRVCPSHLRSSRSRSRSRSEQEDEQQEQRAQEGEEKKEQEVEEISQPQLE